MKWKIALVFIACGLFTLAQVTPPNYPYPKPKPISGSTPTSLIRYSQSIGASAYQNENPPIWAIDVAGGLHSRSNATDRLAVPKNWTEEGALVYDATDKTFYGVGLDLIANLPLFSLDGIWNNGVFNSRTNLYVNAPGANKIYLTADGIDITGTNIFNLDGNSEFTITSSNFTTTATTKMLIGTPGPITFLSSRITNSTGDFVVRVTNGVYLQTPRVMAGLVRAGDVMTYNSSGGVDFSASATTSGILLVTNVAQLLSVPCGTNGPYKYVQTSGYYSVGDGGQGLYYAHPYASALTNTGNFRSTADPNQMWSLLAAREGIYLRQYGAKGDGMSDDTLALNYWLADSRGLNAIANVGIYITDGIGLQEGQYNIRGTAPVGPNETVQDRPGSLGNVAVFKRKAGNSNHLLASANGNTSVLLNNIVLDGSSEVDSANSAAYLYLHNTTNLCSLNNVVVKNTAGHGISFNGTTGSVINNFHILNCAGRGLRLNNAPRSTVSNGRIYNCGDNGIHVIATYGSTLRDVRISDCGLSGLLVEGSQRIWTRNVQILGCKKASIHILTSGERLTFDSCELRAANCQSNASPVAASAPATWPFVLVEGNSSQAIWHVTFANCQIGTWNDNGGYGTNEVSNIFKWTNTSLYPQWMEWSFINNDMQYYAYNYPAPEFSPAIDRRQRTTELGNRYNSAVVYSQFGNAGSFNKIDGLKLEKVANAAGDSPLTISQTTHAITTSGTAIVPTLAEIPTTFPFPPDPPPWNRENP